MKGLLLCIIAGIIAAVLIFLWFRRVYQSLSKKRQSVECARRQLASNRKKHMRIKDGYNSERGQELITKSVDIYRQNVSSYNLTLKKPLNIIPGYLMGFRKLT